MVTGFPYKGGFKNFITQRFGDIHTAGESFYILGSKVGNLTVKSSSEKPASFVLRVHGWIPPEDVMDMEFPELPDGFAPRLAESIIYKDVFKQCIQRRCKTLVLRGIPGVGKTSTIRRIVNHLQEKRVNVASIFIRCDTPNMHSAAMVMMIFLKQLVDGPSNDVSCFIEELYKGTTKVSQDLHPISSALQHAIMPLRDFCIVLDALDEWSDLYELHRLLQAIEQLQVKTGVGVILSERLGDSMTQRYFGRSHGSTREEIELQADSRDTSSYIIHRITSSEAQWMTSQPDIIERVKKEIKQAAKGIFLLLKLFMDTICEVQRELDLDPELENIKSLCGSCNGKQSDEYVDSLLLKAIGGHLSPILREGIDKRNKEYAGAVFRFMRDAMRPMSVEELSHALLIRRTPEAISRKNLLQWEQLQKICYGLITRNKYGTVSFIHSLVAKQFHTKDGMNKFPDGNRILGWSCVTYLALDQFSTGACGSPKALEARMNEYPFLNYAARYWPHHFQKSGIYSRNPEFNGPQEEDRSFFDAAFRFLASNVHVDCSWQIMQTDDKVKAAVTQASLHESTRAELGISILWQDGPSPLKVSDPFGPNRVSGLHLACHYGCEGLVKAILQRKDSGSKTNAEDFRKRTPLWVAANAGHTRVVQMLIQANAKVNKADDCNVTPLHSAAGQGFQEVVELLLEQKCIKVNARTTNIEMMRRYRWDIWRSTEHVEKGQSDGSRADACKNSDYSNQHCSEQIAHSVWQRTALHAAVGKGCLGIVNALLRYGDTQADVHDSEGMTALHKAAKYGHLDVLQVLLKRRDVDSAVPVKIPESGSTSHLSRRLEGCNALHLASKEGRVKLVDYLLDSHPGLRNTPDGHGRTPLHFAAWHSHIDVVRSFLGHALTQISLEDDLGNTPLALSLRGSAFGCQETFEVLWHHPRIQQEKCSKGSGHLVQVAKRRNLKKVLELIQASSDMIEDAQGGHNTPKSSTLKLTSDSATSRTLDQPSGKGSVACERNKTAESLGVSLSYLDVRSNPRLRESRATTPIPELYNDAETGSIAIKGVSYKPEAPEEDLVTSVILNVPDVKAFRGSSTRP